MACSGCAGRRVLLGKAGAAMTRGAWQEAASAARAAAASARVDAGRIASKVAAAAAAVIRKDR